MILHVQSNIAVEPQDYGNSFLQSLVDMIGDGDDMILDDLGRGDKTNNRIES